LILGKEINGDTTWEREHGRTVYTDPHITFSHTEKSLYSDLSLTVAAAVYLCLNFILPPPAYSFSFPALIFKLTSSSFSYLLSFSYKPQQQ